GFRAFYGAQSPLAFSSKAACPARARRPHACRRGPGFGPGAWNCGIWSCRKLGGKASGWASAVVPTPEVSRSAFRRASAFLATDRGLCRLAKRHGVVGG